MSKVVVIDVAGSYTDVAGKNHQLQPGQVIETTGWYAGELIKAGLAHRPQVRNVDKAGNGK